MTETLAAADIQKLGAGPGRISPQRFDVQAYIEDFNTSVIDAYRRGVADVELPSDENVGRSLMGPATARTRDFSNLSPLIPALAAEKCVGCMACVSACPDSAIMATAQPKGSLAESTARSHFVHTAKYGDVPAKKGIEGADFGLFIDPAHCKGCAECVDVCVAQGHDALSMTEKLDSETSGEGTLDRYGRDMAFYKSLPPTPVEYRNEKALADLMLSLI